MSIQKVFVSFSIQCLLGVARASQVPTVSLDQIKPVKTTPPGLAIRPDDLRIEAPSQTGPGIPSDGIDVYIGDELYKQLVATATAHCQQLDVNCEAAITDVLRSKSSRLQTRAVFGIVAAVVIALASMLIGDNAAHHQNLHIPALQLKQLSAALTSSSFVVQPTGGALATTITKGFVQSASSAAKAPTITKAPDDDLIIIMPDETASVLSKMIHEKADDSCELADALDDVSPASRLISHAQIRMAQFSGSMRSPVCSTQETLRDIAAGAIPGILLLSTKHPIISFARADVAQALNVAMKFAASMFGMSEAVSDQLNNVAPLVFAIAYEALVNDIPIGPTMTIKASELQATATATRTQSGCPYATLEINSPICQKSNCNGENPAHRCRAKGRYKDCDCWKRLAAEVSVKNPDWMDFIFSTMSEPPRKWKTGKDSMQVALASYIHPRADPQAWNRMINDYTSERLTVLIVNVLNGPDWKAKAEWTDVIDRASGNRKKIIGYVRTGYLGRTQIATRLGSTEISDWIAQIQGDIEMWYSLYPGRIDGIFLDESWNECGPDNQFSEVYRFLSDHIKRVYPASLTVINPGTQVPQCYELSADTIMTFEGNYSNYINQYHNSDWTSKDFRKFWHVIYGVREDQIQKVATLAKQRRVGLIQITDDVMDNPYDVLPGDSYMRKLLANVAGGRPKIEPRRRYRKDLTPVHPPDYLEIVAVDYASVTLKWTASKESNAAYSYAIYVADKEFTRVPGYISKITIGNLRGPNVFTFTVRSITKDGRSSDPSPPQSTRLKSLPGGRRIFNLKHSREHNLIKYEAEVYLPYGFVRVFITDPDNRCTSSARNPRPGWPINHAAGVVCALYMIEGRTLFRYTGIIPTDNNKYEWTWTKVSHADNVKVSQVQYKIKWEFSKMDLGESTLNTENYVIQAEGYNPFTNVFYPCPKDFWTGPDANSYCIGYDCKSCKLLDSGLCDKAIASIEAGIENRVFRANQQYIAAEGVCWGNGRGLGCKVVIDGLDRRQKNCTISGTGLKNAYHDIKSQGGCKCGTKTLENGCTVRVGHYGSCDNTS